MRIVVGISGASGAVLGLRTLQALAEHPNMETHLVITDSAARTFRAELDMAVEDVHQYATHIHENWDIGALPASGSYVTDGMIIVPSSMKTISSVAHGYADTLISRAADVCIKENRKVVLVPREMPLSKLHLRNLCLCTEYGCSIIPPMLTFYNQSLTVEDQIQHIVGKILQQFGLTHDKFKPWTV